MRKVPVARVKTHGMALQDSLRSEIPAWDPLAILRQERQAR